jgi:serine/threonine protein kinase
MPPLDDEQRDPLEVVASDYLQRQRNGEHPAISDYVARYPALAAQIEDLFPAIGALEQLKTERAGAQSGRGAWAAVQLERLGDFRILREIGRGGMGIVYEAFQESLGRHVAVKVLPRQSLLDAKQSERFRREAQTAARLHHTNIVPLFGVGEQEGHHYFVMQLIEGVSLDAILAQLREFRAAGGAAAAAQDAERPPAGTGSPSEAARLAASLVEGRFWQAEAGSSPSEGALESGQAAGEPSAGAGSPPPSAAAAAGEAISAAAEVRGVAEPAPGPSAAVPAGAAPSRLGRRYWRSVATIGLQVADALGYAHAHHTLHRDIKPANLLLDSQGVVWITDFGLARALDQDHASQATALSGTLRYMAPEQFLGHLDARSDLYSLGLTLYELLTLQPAFADTSRSQLIRKITQQQPPRPRKLDPGVPRDLETIVLKAIAREPAHRYPSALALAGDLQRFLEDRPISARRTSWAERVWRWSRRNRAVAGLAASTLVLLVLFAVVTAAGYVRTARERERAEATSALALEALDNIFQQFAPQRTTPASGRLVVGDAGEEITMAAQPVLSKEAAALLEHMLTFYDRLADQGGDDARLRRKVAEANRRVGDIRLRLGHYDESKAAYLRAIALYQRLAEASPGDGELRREIAKVHNELGNVHRAANEMQAAHACHGDALAVLKASSAESSASPQDQYELARTYYFLGRGPGGQPGPFPLAPGGHRLPRLGFSGSAFWPGPPPGAAGSPGRGDGPRRGPPGLPPGPPPGAAGPGSPPSDSDSRARAARRGGRPPFSFPDPGLAEENLEKAIDLLERLVAQYPAMPAYRHLLARCYRELPPPWFRHSATLAPNATEKAAQILEELVQKYPDVPDYRHDLSQSYVWRTPGWPLVGAASDRAAAQRSREILEKALALSDELVFEHPNIPDYAVSQVHVRLRLADILWEIEPARAEADLRKALELQSTLTRRFPQNSFYRVGMAIIEESLAVFLRDRGQLSEARTAFENTIAGFKEVLQKDPRAGFIRGVVAQNYLNLADVLRRMGNEQAAAKATRQAQPLP